MKEKHLSQKNVQRVLKMLNGREEDGEIGDGNLFIDVYHFKRGRTLHVYYGMYSAGNKSAYITYK